MNLKKIFGLLAFVSFVITTIISIYFYENYDFFFQNFSDLGVGVGAIFFNYGLMLTAILLAIYFYFSFKNKKLFALALLSAIGLFGVGFFPLTFSFEHYISAGIFFITSLFLIFIYLIKAKKTNFKIVSIIPVVIIIAYIFTEMPVMQKFSVFSIILWHLYCVFEKE